MNIWGKTDHKENNFPVEVHIFNLILKEKKRKDKVLAKHYELFNFVEG